MKTLAHSKIGSVPRVVKITAVAAPLPPHAHDSSPPLMSEAAHTQPNADIKMMPTISIRNTQTPQAATMNSLRRRSRTD